MFFLTKVDIKKQGVNCLSPSHYELFCSLSLFPAIQLSLSGAGTGLLTVEESQGVIRVPLLKSGMNERPVLVRVFTGPLTATGQCMGLYTGIFLWGGQCMCDAYECELVYCLINSVNLEGEIPVPPSVCNAVIFLCNAHTIS